VHGVGGGSVEGLPKIPIAKYFPQAPGKKKEQKIFRGGV